MEMSIRLSSSSSSEAFLSATSPPCTRGGEGEGEVGEVRALVFKVMKKKSYIKCRGRENIFCLSDLISFLKEG